MSVVAMKVLKTKRPISGETMGYRIVLAFSNIARYDSFADEYVQSFDAKYRLCEAGDFSTPPEPNQIQKFLLEAMKWHNITKIVSH